MKCKLGEVFSQNCNQLANKPLVMQSLPPNDALGVIFCFLDSEQVLRLRQVCKLFCQVVAQFDKVLFFEAYLQTLQCAQEKLQQVNARKKQVQTVTKLLQKTQKKAQKNTNYLLAWKRYLFFVLVGDVKQVFKTNCNVQQLVPLFVLMSKFEHMPKEMILRAMFEIDMVKVKELPFDTVETIQGMTNVVQWSAKNDIIDKNWYLLLFQLCQMIPHSSEALRHVLQVMQTKNIEIPKVPVQKFLPSVASSQVVECLKEHKLLVPITTVESHHLDALTACSLGMGEYWKFVCNVRITTHFIYLIMMSFPNAPLQEFEWLLDHLDEPITTPFYDNAKLQLILLSAFTMNVRHKDILPFVKAVVERTPKCNVPSCYHDALRVTSYNYDLDVCTQT